MAEPIRIPVVVEMSQAQAALSAFQTQERARGTTDPKGAVNEELKDLVGGLRDLNKEVESLIIGMRAGRGPGAAPGGAGGGGHGRGGGGGEPVDRFIRRQDARRARMAQSEERRAQRRLDLEARRAERETGARRMAMLGALGVGIGAIGFRAQQYGQATESLAHDVLLATLAGGGGVDDYEGLRSLATRRGGPGFRTPLTPAAFTHGAGLLGQIGFPRPAEASALLGSFGLAAGLTPEAGVSLGADIFRTARSERVPEYLATLVKVSEREGLAMAELAQQAGGLFGLLRQTQGQFARGPDEMERMLSLQRFLNAMPGGVGRGEGGVEVAQGLGNFMRSPFGDVVARVAYERSGNRMPQTPMGVVRFEAFRRDPKNLPQFIPLARDLLGAGPLALLLVEQNGLPPDVAAAAAVARTPEEVQEILTRHQAKRTLAERFGEFAGTIGMRGMHLAADLQRVLASTGLGEIHARGRLFLGEQVGVPHPYISDAIMGAGAAGGVYGSFRGFRAFRHLLSGRSPIRMAGRALGAAGAGSLAMRGVPAVGGVLAGKDLYDLFSGGEWEDLLWGGSGALAGGALGAFGGPWGALTGAGLGYSGGRALGELFGATTAGAAAGPDIVYGHGGRVDPASPAFMRSAGRYGLPPGLLEAIASVESSFNPQAVSPTGVRGLMQITGRTGAPYGLTDANRWDPGTQIDTSAQIMRDLLSQYGTLHSALSHYGDPNDPGYAMRVMSRMGDFGGGMGNELGGAPAMGVHLFVHLDPDFPGTIRAQAPPGVTVHTTR